jgi:hypothetical protein
MRKEQDVNAFLRGILEKEVGDSFTTISGQNWATDGVLDWETPSKTPVRVLLEAKYGTDLTIETARSSVLAQALYYCKRFEENGHDLPSVIFIGDEKFCFVVSFESIKSFLDANIDWGRRPSSPDPDLKVSVDVHLESVFEVDGKKLKQLCEQLSEGAIIKVKPSEKNISAMYQYWVDHIFPKDRYQPVEMIDLFFGCVFYSEEDGNYAYEHPSKKDTIILGGKEYTLKLSSMRAFFERRERGLSAKDIDKLLSMRDRIIEDDTRRRQGAFYTPTLWVDEAHKSIEEALGSNWRDDCIVWDCCAGTGNLTRDYDFKDLILSTAEESDVKAMKREDYNNGAEVFQYDFLNPESDSPFFEGTDNVLPLSVKKLLKEGAESGKRLVFLVNPPYATSCIKGSSSRKGVARTTVNQAMKGSKLGACSQQLYAQFLYQCEQVASEYDFKQKSVGVFSPILYMVSGSYAKFRPFWYARYSYARGFMLQASHFADVKGSWAISFTLWNEGTTESNQSLQFTLKDTVGETVVSLGEKYLYSSDKRKASEWVREPVKGLKNFDLPQMKSGLSIAQKGCGNRAKEGICYMLSGGNSLQNSSQMTGLFSTTFSNAHGISVLVGEGWRRSISLYSARKLSKDTWITHNDEYLVPQTEKEGYRQWVDDCHIYALLDNKNNMTAMRGVEYKGKNHNIHNHFFWLTRKEALDLYGSHKSARSLYRDAKSNPIPYHHEGDLVDASEWAKNGDPYFSHVLPSLNLSPLAQEIMSDLNDLFVESFELRSKTSKVIEKGKEIYLHLNAWDASVYQHKKMWYTDPTLKAKWESLRVKHQQLAISLEHGVYSFGFLK